MNCIPVTPVHKRTSSCIFFAYIFYCKKSAVPAVASKNIQPANPHLLASFSHIFFIARKVPFQLPLQKTSSPQTHIFLHLFAIYFLLQEKSRFSDRCKKHPACKPTSSCIFSPYIFYCKKSAVPAATKPSATCIISNKRFVLSIVADF